MDPSVRGLPLLSGHMPLREDPGRSGCRRCAKDFGLFTRSHKCHHCCYSYCSSCCDHKALMPRTGDAPAGYDVVSVCSNCIENLTITASGRAQLREMRIPRLRAYMKAYSIPCPSNILEKDEIVDIIINAREGNGCLSPAKEEYYRHHSVPQGQSDRPRVRSFFSRNTQSQSQSQPQAPPAPTQPPQPRQPPRPTSQPQSQPQPTPQYRTSSASTQSFHSSSVPHGGAGGYYHIHMQNAQAHAQAPRPASFTPPTSMPTPPRQQQAATPAPPPPPPVPSLSELLNMSSEQVSALSIGTLKSILYENHVNARLLLEKEDLVEKVRMLIEAERREREREAQIHALEEQEYLSRQARMMEEERERQRAREAAAAASAAAAAAVAADTGSSEAAGEGGPVSEGAEHGENGEDEMKVDAGPADEKENESKKAESKVEETAPKPPPFNPYANVSPLERTGLCVVCQDEEANIATVDCGHLALCMNCSDQVMKTTRECPLCRTRIVTPSRLLRIYRT
ncbi:hypothetical protein BOTBODRAFT_191140 [Botryobasidium botryosum FD-172 SS1]|uniref:RING-type domain-containing protein n=1 Tax=Botryobasidium botryosum (strain FD-172 SS1) TaxID=930990 RepID=A0A067MCT1_BOTB1|nr:hypothetical protein BOTBODRAFT_191140 [Botryobasidium botryosum FD-172 SS1]